MIRVKDKKEGQGVLTYTSSIVYQGEWFNDLKHGKGKEENLKNGETFEGEWKYGKLTGKGKMVYQTGDIYEGEFNGQIVLFFIFNNTDCLERGVWEICLS